MDGNKIVEYLENFIIDNGNADIILSDRRSEFHYTDITVVDLNYVIRTANKDRVSLVLSVCNREIERQETLMRCAEQHDDDAEWIKHYELQGVYMTIRDILIGNLTEEY